MKEFHADRFILDLKWLGYLAQVSHTAKTGARSGNSLQWRPPPIRTLCRVEYVIPYEGSVLRSTDDGSAGKITREEEEKRTDEALRRCFGGDV